MAIRVVVVGGGLMGLSGAVCPALGDCRVARSWAALEAFTPDGLPILGPVPGVAGLLVAARATASLSLRRSATSWPA